MGLAMSLDVTSMTTSISSPSSPFFKKYLKLYSRKFRCWYFTKAFIAISKWRKISFIYFLKLLISSQKVSNLEDIFFSNNPMKWKIKLTIGQQNETATIPIGGNLYKHMCFFNLLLITKSAWNMYYIVIIWRYMTLQTIMSNTNEL